VREGSEGSLSLVYKAPQNVQNDPVAGHTRPSVNKRLREAQKKEKQAAKAERRAQRAEEKKQRGPAAGGEDPDIAGIVPGPQPLPWGDDESTS